MQEILCPNCKKPIYDEEALLCHFCGESLQRKSSGAFGSLRSAGLRWVLFVTTLFVAVSFLLLNLR